MESPLVPLTPQHEAQVREFLGRHRVGLLTILFTDIVGSVDLKKHLGDTMAVLNIQRHHAAVRDVLRPFKEGEEIETAGDSFLIVFAKPSDAVKFALLLHARLRELAETTGCAVRDRIGIHLGEVFIDEGGAETRKNLFGMQVDTAARVMSLAGAGQTVMTRAVFDNARQVLKGQDLPGIGELLWLSHGPYLLKGVDGPLEICEAGEVGLAPLNAPGDSEKARRHAGADGEPVLGWRPALGQSIPRTQWELTEKLGEGGFGEVWLARHKTLSEARVFKFCFRADRVRSLKREVTLFKVLKERVGEHPRIVRLMDIYFEEPPYYLEMEYVPGRDLATWAKEQGGLDKVPLATRLEIAAQVADALQAAHDCGIIHRDIKPSNILISAPQSSSSSSSKPLSRPSTFAEATADESGTLSPSDGERDGVRGSSVSQPSTPHSQPSVKLTDFGIGQIVSDEALGELTKAGFTQTLLGSTTASASGTRLYMAPELLAGQKATPRSDIYSLGVVLYQLVTGDLARPLTIDWARHVSDPLLREDLEQCFAGDPQERFPAASLLAKQLRSMVERRSELNRQQAEQAARERAVYRRGVMRTAALATVAVSLLAGLAWYAFEQAGKAKVAAEKAKQSAHAETLEKTKAISATGRAEAEADRASRLLYFAHMNLASRAWDEAHVGRVLELLGLHRPQPGRPDLRGFEWHYMYRLCHSELRTLKGHGDMLTSVAFSPDGKRLASASWDRTVKVWDATSGQETLTLTGHTHNVTSVAFSPDGKRLASASWDRTVKVWDATSGDLLLTLNGHTQAVSSVAFSPDGKRLASAGGNALSPNTPGELKVWDATSGQETLTLKGHARSVLSVAFSPDGKRLASASSDTTVKVWNATSGAESLTLKGHTSAVESVVFSPEGQRLASASWDRTVKVWDATSGADLLTLKGHTHYVMSVAFSPDGKRLASASWDKTVKVWDATSGAESLTLKGHTHYVTSVAFSPDGKRLASASWDETVKVWDATSGAESLTLKGHTNMVLSVAFSPDGKRLASASVDQTVKVWDATSGVESLTLKGHTGRVESVAFSPDGKRLASAGGKALLPNTPGELKVWDATSGRETLTLKGHTDKVTSVAFSPDGKQLASASYDGRVKVWDATSGQETLTLKRHDSPVTSVAFSPDGKRLASAGFDMTVRVWDATSGAESLTLKGHSNVLTSVAFSPDGKRLASASYDRTVKVWDATSGRETLTLKGHTGRVESVAFSPDGKRLASASYDRTVKVWDATSGQETLTLKGHTRGVTSVAFSSDGKRLASASEDQAVKVWDATPLSQEGSPASKQSR